MTAQTTLEDLKEIYLTPTERMIIADALDDWLDQRSDETAPFTKLAKRLHERFLS